MLFTIRTFSIFLLFLLATTNATWGQTVFEGKIFDKATHQPIPYSTVEIPGIKTGTVADSAGKFSIRINTEVDSFSVIISSLGYETIHQTFKLGNNYKKIYLQKKIFNLEEVTVVPKNYIEKELGIITKKAPYELFGVIGIQHGIQIKNTTEKSGYVKNVSFYIKKNGFPNCPFRIRIYQMNTATNLPGKDLANKNIIVSYSGKGNKWFSVDLAKYQIPFPKKGVFVAMQWINQGEAFYYPVNFGKHKRKEKYATRYGLILGFSKPDYEPLSWYKYLGNPWTHFKGRSQPMIKAEVQVTSDI